jgi:hypothetical protein
MDAKQLSLFDQARQVRPADPSADTQDRPRITGQNAMILQRLQLGAATNAELCGLSLKYTSRISDLRAAGYRIRAERVDGGLFLYTLEL